MVTKGNESGNVTSEPLHHLLTFLRGGVERKDEKCVPNLDATVVIQVEESSSVPADKKEGE